MELSEMTVEMELSAAQDTQESQGRLEQLDNPVKPGSPAQLENLVQLELLGQLGPPE
jgi:hypothetical protein